jgi:uncharacterized protein involved in response to NO
VNNEGKVVAAVFALSAFAVALIAGLGAGNDTTTVLSRALGALLICQIIGLIAGLIIERVIREHEARYRADNPVPSIGPTVVDEVVDNSPRAAEIGA